MELTNLHLGGDVLIVCLVGLLAWLGRTYVKRLDKHLEECRDRAVSVGRSEEKLQQLEAKMDASRQQIHWMGDCMMVMSTKLDIHLPDRPRGVK